MNALLPTDWNLILARVLHMTAFHCAQNESCLAPSFTGLLTDTWLMYKETNMTEYFS